MTFALHDPADVPAQVGNYAQGLEVPGGARLLFVSGQIPVRPDGTVPVTTYLTSRGQTEINGRIRGERLGAVRPALTVVIARTFAPEWLLEIEAVAAA